MARTLRAPQLLLLMTDLTRWAGGIFASLPWLYLTGWTCDVSTGNLLQGEKIKGLLTRVQKKCYCSSGNICSWSWNWKGLRNTSHAGFLPDGGHKNTHAVCNVSLVTACFPLYGCLSCSDLLLGRCQPPNTLSNRGGIYTQVQPDTGHNACSIKGQGCSFGSHPLAFEREWQRQIKKWKTRWGISAAVPDETDGQLHIWHDWLIRLVDCKAIYVFSCSLTGFDKVKIRWDSLGLIPENMQKKAEKPLTHMHGHFNTCLLFQCAVNTVTSSSTECVRASVWLRGLCTKLFLLYAHVNLKQIHTLCILKPQSFTLGQSFCLVIADPGSLYLTGQLIFYYGALQAHSVPCSSCPLCPWLTSQNKSHGPKCVVVYA